MENRNDQTIFENFAPCWQQSIFQLWSSETAKSWITHPFVYNTDLDFYRYIQRMIERSFHDFRVVAEKTEIGKRFSGTVFSYDFRLNDGHCKICVCPNPSMNVEKSLSAFIHWLFREYPLQKVFFEVNDFNQELIDVCIRLGFQQEANLVDYTYSCGTYHNLIIMGLEREAISNGEAYGKLPSL